MKKVKYIMVGLSLCAVSIGVYAQPTQTMLEQIAALKAFIITAEKGYQIAEDGLHTIRDIRQGEFKLHSAYFSSLSTVKPVIRNTPQVGEIIGLQESIVNQFAKALDADRQSGGLSQGDLDYMGNVYNKVVALGIEDVDALQVLLSDGALQMQDGDRVRSIGVIDGDMRQRYRFVQDFMLRAGLLAAARQKEGAESGILKSIYGLP